MSRSKVDDLFVAEQNLKKETAAAKRRAKANEAREKKKLQKKNDEEHVPVNLEDYKGARKKLRHAVKAVVKAKSSTIAEKLVSKAELGDIRGTEMMLSLIEKKKQGKDEKKKKKREGPSWAELLASEPDWDETVEDDEKKLAAVSGK
jgi:hypothetical protein